MDVKRDTHHLFSVLSAAFLEWLLLILLLFDVLIQYFGSKFAHFCELRRPCLLCSRIDHILGNAKAGFFDGLICEAHKASISSLAYCRAHQKLADVHEMCHACSISFTSQKVAKRERDTRYCSCCSLPFRSRLLGRGLPRNHVVRCDVGFSSRNGTQKKTSRLTAIHPSRNHHTGTLSHTGYCELKVTANSEVKVDNDDERNLVFLPDEAREREFAVRSLKQEKLTLDSESFSTDAFNGATRPGRHELMQSEAKLVVNDPSSSAIRAKQARAEASNSKGGGEFGDLTRNLNSDMNLKTPLILKSNLPSTTIDASKLDIGTKGCLLSPKFAEIVSRRCTNIFSEDLKPVQPHLANGHGLEYPWNDMAFSPRVYGRTDEFKLFECFSPKVSHNIGKRVLLGGNESALETLDSSRISGESMIDHWKQQVLLERDSMRILYEELEEERSASAIAANQAMAMITRLQEEKAAMQMEALQYLRMMEEQAEYDQEALENATELVIQKEQQILNLETVVESYRLQFGDVLVSDAGPGLTGSNKSNHTDIRSGFIKDPLPDFEDEKVNIVECLNRLEKKLKLFMSLSTKGSKEGEDTAERVAREQANSSNANRTSQVSDSSAINVNATEEDNQIEGQVMPETCDAEMAIDDAKLRSRLNYDLDGDGKYQMHKKESNLVVFVDELSHLNERLEALEAEKNVLKQSIHSLSNGDEGLHYIQEIANHLRELRKATTQRGNVVS